MQINQLPEYRQETIRLVQACTIPAHYKEERKLKLQMRGMCHCPTCTKVLLQNSRSIAERMKYRSTLALQRAYMEYLALGDDEKYTPRGDMIVEKYAYAVKQERECWQALRSK